MVDTRACVRLEPRRNAAVWAMDAWEAMANAMLLVRCVVVRIEVRRRLVSWVQKAKTIFVSAGVNRLKTPRTQFAQPNAR